MGQKESPIEVYLFNQVKQLGGIALKYIQGEGKPDRIVIFGHQVWLVETKAPDGELSPLQIEEFAKLERKGIRVRVVYTKAQVLNLINEIANTK